MCCLLGWLIARIGLVAWVVAWMVAGLVGFTHGHFGAGCWMLDTLDAVNTKHAVVYGTRCVCVEVIG